MKIRSMVAFAGTLCFTGSLTQAAITDITISDGLVADAPGGLENSNGLFGTTDPRFPVDADGQKQREFGEVENGNSEYSSWDLRAFGYDADNKRLIYQGGMDISREVNSSNNPAGAVTTTTTTTTQTSAKLGYGIGSIFIKIGADATFKPPIWSNDSTSPATNGGYARINNSALPGDGFDYAITLLTGATGTLNYIIYDLNANSKLTMPYYGSNDEAGPYAYLREDHIVNGVDSNVVAVGQQNTGILLQTSAQVNTLYGDLQGFGVDNYIASFNLGAVGAEVNEKGAFFYLTQECGNDSLVGRVIAVPEPGNMVGLMGLLVGGAFLRIRRRA